MHARLPPVGLSSWLVEPFEAIVLIWRRLDPLLFIVAARLSILRLALVLKPESRLTLVAACVRGGTGN